MKKVPTWVLVGGGLAVVYLLARNVSQLRMDAYRVGRNISERSGGTIPTPPRSWLPTVNADPGFGVSFDLPDFLKVQAANAPRYYAGGSPGFYTDYPPRSVDFGVRLN